MMHFTTPYGDHYVVNERGELAKNNDKHFGSQWLFLGIQHVERNEFIPIEDLTPERVKQLELRYKNGKPQYTVKDLDHGTPRLWGNTASRGIADIYFDADFAPVERVNGTTANTRAYQARQVVGTVQVVGVIWQGIECEYQYPITRGDMGTIGEFTRDNVSKWLDRRAGDF